MKDHIEHYDPAFFPKLIRIEDRHFWFRVRNQIIASLVRQLVSDLEPGYRVLEIGCGTGNVLRTLEQSCSNGVVVGMDLFTEGLKYARGRTSCSLVQGDLNKPPFQTYFSLIGLFDVLEHMPKDNEVLSILHGLLVPNGALIITVPAHHSLWSYFDEAGYHCRRYEVEELHNKLTKAGYQVEYLTEYMSILFPIVWLGRRLAALYGRGFVDNYDNADGIASREFSIIPVVNDFLVSLLQLETNWIAKRRKLPVGSSLITIARKIQMTK